MSIFELLGKKEKVSENLFWVTQLVFGLVLAQGLIRNSDIILDPFNPKNILVFIALINLYAATLLSWIDFSESIVDYPYGLPHRYLIPRLFMDILTVIFYGAILFSIDLLRKDNVLFRFLFFYIFVYLLYLGSGVLRIIQYGKYASKWKLILIFFVLFIIQYFAYKFFMDYDNFNHITINYIFIISSLSLTIIYRYIRHKQKEDMNKVKDNGLRIAIDIDGVLANHIDYLLPIINEKYKINLHYDSISKWDLKVDNTDIKQIIEDRQIIDEKYIMNMLLHPYARNVIEQLYETNQILIITARDAKIDDQTKEWLQSNKIKYDKYLNCKKKNKYENIIDVIIDDYPENIEKIVIDSNKFGILFEQPWNKNIMILNPYIGKNVYKVSSWQQVQEVIEEIKLKKQGK
jgi:uncharacterized HAD superfamily protein